MLFPLIFILFIQIARISPQCLQFKINDQGECYCCGDGFYSDSTEFMNYLGRINVSNCKAITNVGTTSIIAYISLATSTCGTSCDGSKASPFQNLVTAFTSTWNLAKTYKSSSLEFILMSGTHYVFEAQIGAKAKQFFRGLNATIKIRPCYTSEDASCYAVGSKGNLIIKTDLLYLFVSNSLEISDINITFDDIWSTAITCRDSSTACCSLATMNSTNATCSLYKRTITYQKNREDSNAAFINSEPLLDSAKYLTPTIKLTNLVISNLYSTNDQLGFNSFFQHKDFSFALEMTGVTLDSIFLPSGILHQRAAKDKFFLYLTETLYNSEKGKSSQTVKLTSVTINGFNKYEMVTTAGPMFELYDELKSIAISSFSITTSIHRSAEVFLLSFTTTTVAGFAAKSLSIDGCIVTGNGLKRLISLLSSETSISAKASISKVTANGNNYEDLVYLENFDFSFTNSTVSSETFSGSILRFQHCHLLFKFNTFSSLFKPNQTETNPLIDIITLYSETSQKIVENSNSGKPNVTNDLIYLQFSTFDNITTQILKIRHSILYFEIDTCIISNVFKNAHIFDVLAMERTFYIRNSKIINVDAGKNKIFYIWWNQGSSISNCVFSNVSCQYIIHTESTFAPQFWLNLTETSIYNSKFDAVMTAEGYYLGNCYNNFINGVILKNIKPMKTTTSAYAFKIGGDNLTISDFVLISSEDFSILQLSKYLDAVEIKLLNIFVRTTPILSQGLLDISVPQTKIMTISGLFTEIMTKITFERLLNLKKCLQLTIKDSVFRDIYSTEGVLISFETISLSTYLIQNNTFINIQGEKQPAVFVIKTDAPTTFNFSKFEGIPANNSNNAYGIINAFFLKSDFSFFIQLMKDSQLYLKNVTFLYGIGGVVDMQSNAKLAIENAIIKGTINKRNNGGVFNLASLSSISLFSTNITDSSSTERGGVIFSQNSFISMKDTNIFNSKSSSGGVVYSEKSKIIILNCSFNVSLVKTRGGFFLCKEGSFSATTATFSSAVSGVEASGVYTFLANVTLSTVTFFNCTSQTGDGTLYLIENPDIPNLLNGLTCKGNKAKNGACILAYNIQLSLTNFKVDGNEATDTTIIEIFSVKGKMILTINTFVYSANTAVQGISFRDLQIKGSAFTMENNKISSSSPIKITDSSITLSSLTFTSSNTRLGDIVNVFDVSNTQFKLSSSTFSFANAFTLIACSRCDSSEMANVRVEGGYVGSNKALVDISGSVFGVRDSLFTQNTGEGNSQILKFSASQVVISNISFTSNNFSNTSSLLQSKANTFSEQITLTIDGFTSLSNSAAFVISTEMLLKQKLTGINFMSNSLPTQGAIDILDSEIVAISNSAVKGFGGASSVSIVNDNTVFVDLQITNSNFENCIGSSSGGCLSVVGNINGAISSSSFVNGSSLKEGGAFYYNCQPSNCNFTIDQQSWFRDNTASASGWAVKSAYQTVKTNGTLNITMSTTPSSSYTPMAGRSSKAFLVIGESNKTKLLEIAKGSNKYNLTKLRVDLNNQSNNDMFINSTSGEKLILAFYYLDDYNNHMPFDNTTLLKIDALDSDKNTIVFENNVIQNSENIFLFENFTIVVTPGARYTVRVILKTSQEETYFNITFDLRRCKKGEIYLNLKCLKCEANFFSLDKDPISHNTTKCKECPKSKADCLSGDIIIPKDNYWRLNYDSEYFIPCPLQNCNSPLNDYKSGVSTNIMAVCDDGYKSNLCIDCSNGYGKFDSKQCLECNSLISGLGKAFVVIAFSVVLVYQIYSTFNEQEISQKQTAFIKIMVNHLTYMSLLSKFQLGIPTDFLSSLQKITDYLPTSPEAAMTFDCLLTKKGKTDKEFVSTKLALILVLPFAYSLLCTGIKLAVDWIIPKLIKNKRAQKALGALPNVRKRKKFIITYVSSLIVLFYNLYPHLLMVITFLVGCTQLEGPSDTELTGPSYLLNFPQIQCWTDEHRDILLAIAVPDLLIWIIGTPILFLIISRMAHNKMKNEETGGSEFETLIFKYFVSDYKLAYYYWESFSFLRKFSIIVLAFLMRDLEPISQGGLLVFTFFVFLYVHENCHPYKEALPNYFEAFSFIICIATTALIILISSGSSQSTPNTEFDIKSIFLIILMGIFNFVFYSSWGFIMFKLYWSDYKGILDKIKAVTLKKRSFSSSPRRKKVSSSKTKKSAVVPKNGLTSLASKTDPKEDLKSSN